MLPILWRAAARDDLTAIVRYIAERDQRAADNMRALLASAVLPLAEHPYLFRAGRVPGTRELVAHPNYVIVYRILADQIEIVSVLHARQKYP